MRTLCLDFDEPLDIDQLEKRMEVIADNTQINLLLVSVHPTARGCHAIVRAMPRNGVYDTPELAANQRNELTPMEVVALQILLGSDTMREAYNFQRARILGDVPAFWRDRWNVDYVEKL